MYIENINGPEDVKKLSDEQLNVLAEEIQIGRASCRERV